MNLLSMFGPSAAKKERDKELQHGDRILVEFGHDRVPLYINMFDIPRNAQLFINAMGLPSLKRRIKLPDVAKFMYDDYLAWIDMTEDSAEEMSWCNVILMAYTAKLLQDTVNHDKALLTMIAKGEAVNYDRNLLFTRNEWNLLQLHIHARDTRDEAMRQVLGRLFKRSDGLMELVGASLKQFTAIGLDWKALHEGTAVGETTAPDNNNDSTEPSSMFDEAFDTITSNDLEVNSIEGTEYDSISIRSFSTIAGDSVAGEADDLGGLEADDLGGLEADDLGGLDANDVDFDALDDVGDLDADSDLVSSIIAAVAQIDEEAAIPETGAVNTKAGDNTAITPEAEETIPVNTKAEDNVAVTTNAGGNTSVVTEARENVAVNNDAEKNTTVNKEAEEDVAVTTKADDIATEKSPGLTIWSYLAMRKHPAGSCTRQDDDNPEFKAGFSPRRELPRTPPGSPPKTEQEVVNSQNYQNTDGNANINPGAQIYQPPHRHPNTEANPFDWHDGTAPRNSRGVNKHPRGRGRQLPNLKYPKSVLNTLRAKQTVWPGDADSDTSNDSGKLSTNWRQPKGPSVAGD